jgi:hypothetical protein
MRYEKVWFQFTNAEWTFFDCHLSFFTGNFFNFQWPKVDQVRNEYLRSYLN